MRTKIHLLGWAAAVMALVACQEKQAPDNPTYNPETNTVNAQFVLNVSPGTGKDTKTTAEFAQIGGSFLGMEAVHMLAYQLNDANKGKGSAASQGNFFYNPVVDGKPVAASRDFYLGSLFDKGDVSTDKSSRIIELALPLGTNSVSIFGKAAKTADSDYQGSTIATGNPEDLTTLKFTLESRLTSMDAYNVGAFFFSSIFTYLMSTGLVNENNFWTYPSGIVDRSYGFWYPVPEASVEGFPSNPKDQDTATIGGVTYTYYTGQLSWKNLGTMYYYEVDNNSSTDPNTVAKTAGNGDNMPVPYQVNALGDALGNAYYVLSTVVKQGDLKELRAGSASAVLRVCEDLYATMERCAAADPTSWEEHCAKLLAQLLKERMEMYFKLYSDGFNFIRDDEGVVYVDSLKTVLYQTSSQKRWNEMESLVNKYFKGDSGVKYFYNVGAGNYGFPINVGLPYGAAVLECVPAWDQQKQMDVFNYTTDIPAYGMGSATFPIANYRYPPELMYYGNSAIRVNDAEVTDYPPTAATWSDESKWTGWTNNGAVKASTSSVAMKNTINYGTALLRSEVRYKEGVTELVDNNAALHPGEQDHVIKLEDGKGFLVTGIVIGGQPDVVGWDFTRYPDSNDQYIDMGWDSENQKYTGLTFNDNGFDKMVYDRVVGGYTVGLTTTPIYTMLWDNYDATRPANDQNDVYIGVELLNNTGEDFWGELNLVRKSGVFYLVGKLDLSTAVENARAKDPEAFKNLSRKDYCYPPFRPDTGETVNAPRVFMQDYVTEAVLNLDKKALQHAYITVPDMRASQVSLGLSIDLAWKPGLAFSINLGVLE